MFRKKSMLIAIAATLTLAAASVALAQSSTSTMPSTGATSSKSHSSTTTTHHASAPKVDLNSASKEDLMKLPGVNEATADKIIAARPLKSKGELTSKNLVTKAEYNKLASHVIVKTEAKK